MPAPWKSWKTKIFSIHSWKVLDISITTSLQDINSKQTWTRRIKLVICTWDTKLLGELSLYKICDFPSKFPVPWRNEVELYFMLPSLQ
jgi:hypothetical protein